jgi:hypothetical protein
MIDPDDVDPAFDVIRRLMLIQRSELCVATNRQESQHDVASNLSWEGNRTSGATAMANCRRGCCACVRRGHRMLALLAGPGWIWPQNEIVR